MKTPPPTLEFLTTCFLAFRRLIRSFTRRGRHLNLAERLEKVVLKNSLNIEDRESELAIKMNVNADMFVAAWNIVAMRNPTLFPLTNLKRDDLLFEKAIIELAESSTRIIKRSDVVFISMLSKEKVNDRWPSVKTMPASYGCYVED